MLSLSSLTKKPEKQIILGVGSVIYTSLYGLGRGVIFHIHGQQRPETIKTLGGGVIVSGGNAHFDIVHECGKFSKRLPESILRGVQWEILDEKMDADEIRRLCLYAEEEDARRKREEEEQTARFNAEVERLRSAPEYGHLEQGECSSGKLAAKNIRKELKKSFKGVKFSVRNPHYGSVDVCWQDGPRCEKVDAIINKYKDGHFNAMEDIYEYSSSPFNTVYGSAKYPDSSRTFSDAMIEKAIAKVISDYHLDYETAPTAEDLNKGNLWSEKREVFHHGLQSKIYSVLSEME